MKKYLIKTLFFVLPLLLLFLSAEIYIRNSPNTFITKAHYFNANKENIKNLILGPSYIQNGVNPKFFKNNTCNLGYASQDIQIDSALFFKNVKEMKLLKKVVLDLSYPRMDYQEEKDYFRYPWYYIYYGIELNEISPLNKISIYSSSSSYFNKIIENDLKGKKSMQVINKYGFVEANYINQFKEINYDSLKIVSTAAERLKNRHTEISDEIFDKNKIRVESIIKYCNENNLDIYLVSTPYFFTYTKTLVKRKNIKVRNYINYLVKKYKIKHLDFESDSRFHLKDFSNDDHLNADGAKKYTEILSKEIE